MGYETSKFGKADGSNVLQTVNTHFGGRYTGGSEGVVKTVGSEFEYILNLDGDGPLGRGFPVLKGCKVIGVDKSFVTGTITAIAIGGVSVNAASVASPVTIADTNTGVVTQTGGTGGDIIIKFKRNA